MGMGGERVLVVDVGGTRTRLALALQEGGHVRLWDEHTVYSRQFSCFEAVLDHYKQQANGGWRCVMAGVSGPVADQMAQVTNLPWRIDAQAIQAGGYGPCRLLNDLEAVAWGVPALAQEELFCLQEGRVAPGNRAVIAAGTGLGEAGMMFGGDCWRPFATEGGHADFAPRDAREVALWGELAHRYGHVSWERVVSGMALPELYQFLCRYHNEPASVLADGAPSSMEPAAALTAAAMDGDALCETLLVWFAALYGAEAGNLALKILSRGGLYVAGGIAPKILPFLQRPEFLEAFCAKGRMRPLLESMPVHVVLSDRVALYGLALAANQAEIC